MSRLGGGCCRANREYIRTQPARRKWIDSRAVTSGIAVAVGIHASGLKSHWLPGLRKENGPDLESVHERLDQAALRFDIRYLVGHGERELVPYIQVRTRPVRSEEHTSELQSRGHLVCRLL